MAGLIGFAQGEIARTDDASEPRPIAGISPPVSDADERMCGIVTDRDIVVKCVAMGHDPAKVTAGQLCEGTPRWVEADQDVSSVLAAMETHQIRRMPVVRNKKLVGMISEADIARHLPDDQVAEFVERICAA